MKETTIFLKKINRVLKRNNVFGAKSLSFSSVSILVPRGRDPSGLRQESSRFLAQTRRIAASGDENGKFQAN